MCEYQKQSILPTHKSSIRKATHPKCEDHEQREAERIVVVVVVGKTIYHQHELRKRRKTCVAIFILI